MFLAKKGNKTMKKALLILTLLFSTNNAFAEFVKYVYDGDTFTTTDGKKVRLLNINTPETAKKNKPSEAYAVKAKKHLEKLIDKKEVVLKYDEEKKDKYKRYLAYVYLKDGTFVNAEMLKSGLAHIYSFPKNVSKYNELKKSENYARKSNLNMWSDPRWQVQNANYKKAVEKFRFGKYQTFKGKILNVAKIGNKTFLNFGHNWRTDFSVEIHKKYLRYFTQQNINPEQYYKGKTVIVRGILRPVNGALISATHPQQIEVLK